MKTATLLHNPGAGDEDHDKDALLRMIESEGYICHYVPVKENGMDSLGEGTDFIIIAGGDGTVRKVAKQLLLNKTSLFHIPLTILPMGTANNIARNLGYSVNISDVIKSWAEMHVQSIDVWNIDNLPGARFFAEGFGFGVFPELMKQMEEHQGEEDKSPEDELKIALSKLASITAGFEAVHCQIIADGKDYSGEYILVEAMNIGSIGPNLHLASVANPADETLELILLKKEQQQTFENYLKRKINGSLIPYNAELIKAKKLELQWHGELVHVDDELIRLKEPKTITISIEGRKLNFMVP